MLHIDYLRVGSAVELPELSGHVPPGPTAFTVEGVYPGGMGISVHLRHTPSGAEYALKGVRPELFADQETFDRFLDEIQVCLSASACDLVAEVLGVLRINEMPCILSTWMPHGDLAQALPRLSKIEKIETVLRLVRALSWVHSNLGVIHRDLKPSNLLLDSQDLAYVADWGLARPIGHILKSTKSEAHTDAIDRPDRTQKGSFLGTVTYSAPEQINCTDLVDHRADIYALGCIMFEFETGNPPFSGQTVSEIANKHLREEPKKLGGWLNSTELGLEHIIARCLKKSPDARYQTYADLATDVLTVANRQGIRFDRCALGLRSKRTVLGKGRDQQAYLFANVTVVNSEGDALVEFDDVAPFLEEATNLMALSRFAEAEALLLPYVIPELLDSRPWGSQHAIAVNYGLCLIKMGRVMEAEALFVLLARASHKPAEFCVNYSLALLGLRRPREAADVCLSGLREYPGDPDIQGNLTISFSTSGDYEQACHSALRRLSLRRDVHGFDEAASVLLRHAESLRNADLPAAIEKAKTMGQLVKEALRLNARYYTIRLKEIRLRRFAHDVEAMFVLVQGMLDAEDCSLVYRRFALVELIEHLSEGEAFESALELIQRFRLSEEPRARETMLRTIARHRMIGLNARDGKRVVVRQVVDFFLHESPNGSLPDPVLAAEILEWRGDQDGAIKVLEAHLSKAEGDWQGLKLMAMIQLRQGRHAMAVEYAQTLVKQAPWRAESYDLMAYVASEAGHGDLEEYAKSMGERIFAEEIRLYDELRASLDQ